MSLSQVKKNILGHRDACIHPVADLYPPDLARNRSINSIKSKSGNETAIISVTEVENTRRKGDASK